MHILTSIIKELRPQQWVKNGFVLLPLFFSGQAIVAHSFFRALIAFAVFSAAASALYLWNDILDREEDKKHPAKRLRPIANGDLAVSIGSLVAVILSIFALVMSYYFGAQFLLVVTSYMLLTMIYSLWLKRVIIFDTMLIMSGFILRVIGGGLAILVPISEWLFVTVAFLALFLAVMKRYSEYISLAFENQRAVMGSYSPEILQQMISVGIVGTILSYSLYTFSLPDQTLTRWTVLIAMFAMFRYLITAMREGGDGQPERVIFTDKILLASLVIFAVYLGVVLYA